MEYNTQRSKLILPEFGRNVQKVIESITNVEDKQLRTQLANNFIETLSQMYQEEKEGDFIHKLWDQMYIMSDYQLDVDSKYPKPTPEEVNVKPRRISYKNNKIRYRHFGNNVQMLIDNIIEMEDSEEKDKSIKLLILQMKKLYLTWNRDSIDDELIYENIEELSNGQIKITDEIISDLSVNKNLSKSSTNKRKQSSNKSKSSKNKSKKK
ncbi:MAG: DUF4290 domain-containing protein [Bacteroidales bacterium]|jgi:hypothetical protein